MPYVSRAQEKYFNANKKALEAKGVDVNEWNQASKGLNLPKRINRKVMHAGRRASRLPSEHLNPNASHFDAIGADE